MKPLASASRFSLAEMIRWCSPLVHLVQLDVGEVSGGCDSGFRWKVQCSQDCWKNSVTVLLHDVANARRTLQSDLSKTA